MTLAALPTELQELIISFLDQQHDLASLSLTSHHFRSLTDRQLYRTIHLKTTVQAGLFSRAVKQQSRAQIVRHLLLDVYETDFRIYDWAARRLSQEHNKDVDLYLRGRNFGSRVLGLFKNIEVLNIHAVAWPFDQVRAVLESVETSEGLNALRSCSLAFKQPEDARGSEWDFEPWSKLLHHPQLRDLELIRADGDLPSDTSKTSTIPKHTTDLQSLRLLDCVMSHRWLSTYLQIPKVLKTLEIVVTGSRSLSFAEHMFLTRCSCMAPICNTLQSLTYLNLRSISGNHVTHQFGMFTELKELTVSASELFGDMSRRGIELVHNHWRLSLPPSLERLNLYVHVVDIHRDPEGRRQGIWKVLRELLQPRDDRPLPHLKQIILHVISKKASMPWMLEELGKQCGIEIRLASMKEVMELREKLRLRLLLS